MNLILNNNERPRRVGIAPSVARTRRISRARFCHFHLLTERRKNNNEKVTQWMIGQTNGFAVKGLLFASSCSLLPRLPSARQVSSVVPVADERSARVRYRGVAVCVNRVRQQ